MPERIHKELVAPSDTKHLVRIRQIIQDVAGRTFGDEKDVARVVLAVDEAVANIMEHAYEDMDTPGDIRITISADDARFEVVICDSGKEFNPGSIDAPDMLNHIKRGKKKGLGVFLMRQIMDEVKYTFVQGLRNELRMIKYVRN